MQPSTKGPKALHLSLPDKRWATFYSKGLSKKYSLTNISLYKTGNYFVKPVFFPRNMVNILVSRVSNLVLKDIPSVVFTICSENDLSELPPKNSLTLIIINYLLILIKKKLVIISNNYNCFIQ